MPGLLARNISKDYGRIHALTDVSFDVGGGEIFGVIGPDGAGKTTLFRILTTLLLPDSGTARVDGLDIRRDYREIRRRVGYMPGRFSLYQDLSVQENLKFYAAVFGTTVRENYHLVKDIYGQLEPFKDRRAGALSGGMKQKLALSCALIHKPSVLFLDEPTTGVDAVSRREFWEMLKNLGRQGLSIVVSTPYMDEAAMCDRIALALGGRFLRQDTPAAIVAGFDRTILAVSSDRMSALLRDLRDFKGIVSCHAFGDTHHVTVTDGFDIERLRGYLSRGNHSGIDIHPITPGIEDCFMALAEAGATTPAIDVTSLVTEVPS